MSTRHDWSLCTATAIYALFRVNGILHRSEVRLTMKTKRTVYFRVDNRERDIILLVPPLFFLTPYKKRLLYAKPIDHDTFCCFDRKNFNALSIARSIDIADSVSTIVWIESKRQLIRSKSIDRVGLSEKKKRSINRCIKIKW